MRSKSLKVYFLLHFILLIYSTSGIFSKMAAGQEWESTAFVVCYAGMIMVLFIYTLGWQQVIKNLPLSVAFAHRPVTIVWGMVWGYLLFGEYITVTNILGAVVIMTGIVIYSQAEEETPHD